MGAEMKELIDADQVSRLFGLLAIILPPLCLFGGWCIGGRRGQRRQGIVAGLLIGLLGPLNLLMWRVFNGITDTVGLDTVRNLLINVALFVTVGVVIGVATGFALRRFDAATANSSPTDESE